MERVSSTAVFRGLGQLVLVGVLLVFYAPVVMIILYSFNESRLGSVWTGFSTR